MGGVGRETALFCCKRKRSELSKSFQMWERLQFFDECAGLQRRRAQPPSLVDDLHHSDNSVRLTTCCRENKT